MVAEVCLGKVGAVAARGVSRFARNSRDWQQLIEMCRVVDTVLVDQEAVYAPRLGNRCGMSLEKIRPHHLDRKAILYVRQSSTHQVLHNRESSTLQYAMRGRLAALGW